MSPDTCYCGNFVVVLVCGTHAQSLFAPFSYTLYVRVSIYTHNMLYIDSRTRTVLPWGVSCGYHSSTALYMKTDLWAWSSYIFTLYCLISNAIWCYWNLDTFSEKIYIVLSLLCNAILGLFWNLSQKKVITIRISKHYVFHKVTDAICAYDDTTVKYSVILLNLKEYFFISRSTD
jgi:hypothetical protein